METQGTIQTIDFLLKTEEYTKASKLIQKTIDREIDKQQEVEETVSLFSKLYDKLYYYILFDKISIDKKTIRQLELLAMPIESKTKDERKELITTIRKGRE